MIEPLAEMFQQGGWVLVAIIGVSVIAWTVILREWLRLPQQCAQQCESVHQVMAMLQDPNATQQCAHQLATLREHEHPTFEEALLRWAVFVKTTQVEKAASQAMLLVASASVNFRSSLRLIAVLAAIMPLLGLLGTVLGMIQTFDVLQQFGVAQIDAMAEGISQALITTQAGLVVAVPVLLMHQYLEAKGHRYLENVRMLLKKYESLCCPPVQS